MLRIAAVVIVPALLLAGCAQNPPAKGKAAVAASPSSAGDSGVFCDREKPTGSHMPRRVCRSAEEREASRRATEDALQSGSRRGVSNQSSTTR